MPKTGNIIHVAEYFSQKYKDLISISQENKYKTKSH